MKKFVSGLRLRQKRCESSKVASLEDRSSSAIPDSTCTIVPDAATTVDPIGAQNPSSQTDVTAIPQSPLSNPGVEQEGRNLLLVEHDHQQGH